MKTKAAACATHDRIPQTGLIDGGPPRARCGPAVGRHNAEVKTSELPDRYAGVEARIPETWDELQGPATGVVHLPNRLAWSGLTDFDVSDPGDRFALFCILLDCEQCADVGRYVNRDLLRREWPRLRRATTSQITRRWEQRLPGLAA